jgi:hypothetical protein
MMDQILDNLTEKNNPNILNYFHLFDCGGMTPIDIVLSKWEYNLIYEFLQKSMKIKDIHLPRSCLNQILRNPRLRHPQVSDLLHRCLSAEVALRGYCHPVIRQYYKKR